ncbi:Cyclin-A1-1 [Camellia lanceoleosa]|uniref:Cyclin-A1-1 n=1 Tax=Camellia lanceoleosa TaxID=1840588 RepID=A0ACC0HT15_9ERIC|nr:Cyclin-A1-1 [Camellia lanceoleosa]
MAKRHLGLENPGKAMAAKPKLVKKRPTLADLMNQTNGSLNAPRAVVVSKKPMVPCEVDIAKMKKESSTLCYNKSIYENLLPTSCNVKSRTNVSCQDTCFQRADQPAASITASSSMDVSPSKSDGGSVSLDETMSTCDFLRSPEFEYIDNDDALAVNSIERKACSSLDISDPEGIAGNICKRDILVEIKTVNRVVGIDDSITDPQFCATFACEIYKNLQASERKKMPRTDFVERIQEDINASMRAILIDWLVEVAEEYSLVPETLFLTVNYIDRYLSGNVIQRQRLQLLGVACMMIAAKYEEICAPQVEEFCYVADNTCFKKEVLQMESSVLNYLKFEMSAPTAGFFLTRFVRAAQGINEVPSMQFGYLANYLTELSLLEYGMLCYAPSLIAASAIFLAKFMLNPLKRPWTLTLMHYTLYKPSDLRDCVKAIHRLVCNIHSSSLPAIREKYSQHKNALSLTPFIYIYAERVPTALPSSSGVVDVPSGLEGVEWHVDEVTEQRPSPAELSESQLQQPVGDENCWSHMMDELAMVVGPGAGSDEEVMEFGVNEEIGSHEFELDSVTVGSDVDIPVPDEVSAWVLSRINEVSQLLGVSFEGH